ncbi:MAG TPA: VCBS repeat-containing protein, partial [Candidatus Poseidoniales archaeon]|nr:VCBS repeat-containing protein [Candidatus Poseidoniales archaeon]
MLASLKNVNSNARDGRLAILLVMIMLSSPMLSLIPAVSASGITQYAVQRDPAYISIGDLDCDGDNDIAAASSMGHFISVLYNDGNGGFKDRQDVFISNNDSHRAGFRDTADGVRIEIADVNGDGTND